MSDRETIVFDLDEVLANLRDPIMRAMHKASGKLIHHREWEKHDLTQAYQVSNEVLLEIFCEHAVLQSAHPEPGARETIDLAKRCGFQVAILTARAWHPEGAAITEDWLYRHRIEPDFLHLVNLHEKKSDLVADYGAVRFLIDDHPGHIQDISKLVNVHRAVLRDRPWNKHMREYLRVCSLEQFQIIIKESVE